MTFATIFYILIAHITGDFFLQSQKMAEGKSGKNWGLYLMLHCFYYFVAILFASPVIFQSYCGMTFSRVHILFAVVASIFHFGVDMFTAPIYEHFVKSEGGFKRGFFNTLGVDQFVHLASLFFLVGAMAKSNF